MDTQRKDAVLDRAAEPVAPFRAPYAGADEEIAARFLAAPPPDPETEARIDARARRQVEADRAKPRSNARNVTLISAAALVMLTVNGQFMAPYGTPLGQVVLAVLLTLYGLALLWLRRMSQGQPLPRFMGDQVRAEVRS